MPVGDRFAAWPARWGCSNQQVKQVDAASAERRRRTSRKSQTADDETRAWVKTRLPGVCVTIGDVSRFRSRQADRLVICGLNSARGELRRTSSNAGRISETGQPHGCDRIAEVEAGAGSLAALHDRELESSIAPLPLRPWGQLARYLLAVDKSRQRSTGVHGEHQCWLSQEIVRIESMAHRAAAGRAQARPAGLIGRSHIPVETGLLRIEECMASLIWALQLIDRLVWPPAFTPQAQDALQSTRISLVICPQPSLVIEQSEAGILLVARADDKW